jgi:hypothetical protein
MEFRKKIFYRCVLRQRRPISTVHNTDSTYRTLLLKGLSDLTRMAQKGTYPGTGYPNSKPVLRIRIRDPGSGAWPLDPGSGIGFFRIPDLGSQTHIFESLMTIFWVESSLILCKLVQIFFFTSWKLMQFSILWFLWQQKKVGQQIFIHHSFFVAIFGSGILYPGSGIRDPVSEIRDPVFEIRYPRSGIRYPRSGIRDGQKSGSGIREPGTGIRDPGTGNQDPG